MGVPPSLMPFLPAPSRTWRRGRCRLRAARGTLLPRGLLSAASAPHPCSLETAVAQDSLAGPSWPPQAGLTALVAARLQLPPHVAQLNEHERNRSTASRHTPVANSRLRPSSPKLARHEALTVPGRRRRLRDIGDVAFHAGTLRGLYCRAALRGLPWRRPRRARCCHRDPPRGARHAAGLGRVWACDLVSQHRHRRLGRRVQPHCALCCRDRRLRQVDCTAAPSSQHNLLRYVETFIPANTFTRRAP